MYFIRFTWNTGRFKWISQSINSRETAPLRVKRPVHRIKVSRRLSLLIKERSDPWFNDGIKRRYKSTCRKLWWNNDIEKRSGSRLQAQRIVAPNEGKTTLHPCRLRWVPEGMRFHAIVMIALLPVVIAIIAIIMLAVIAGILFRGHALANLDRAIAVRDTSN